MTQTAIPRVVQRNMIRGPMGPHLFGYAEAKWPRYYQDFMSGLGVGKNSGFQAVIPQAQLI